MTLIIDENYIRYQPMFALSKLSLFEYDIKKHDKAYIYVDTMEGIEYVLGYENLTLVSDRDIIFRRELNLEIKKVNYRPKPEDFIGKVLRNENIRKYIFG